MNKKTKNQRGAAGSLRTTTRTRVISFFRDVASHNARATSRMF
jgi:hypothetical protein